VDLIAVIYTVHLALHYFRRNPDTPNYDRCLIATGSVSSYLDQKGAIQYNAAKFGVRGMFRSLRSTAWQQGIRVNMIAPWYAQTGAMSDSVMEFLRSKGVQFVNLKDAEMLVKFISANTELNGKFWGLVPREFDKNGFFDLAIDDFDDESVYRKWQELFNHASHRAQVDPSRQ